MYRGGIKDILTQRGLVLKEKLNPNIVVKPNQKELEEEYIDKYLKKRVYRTAISKAIQQKQNIKPSSFSSIQNIEKAKKFHEFLDKAGIIVKDESTYTLSLGVNDFGSTFEWLVSKVLDQKKYMTLTNAIITNLKTYGDVDVMACTPNIFCNIEVKARPLNNVSKTHLKNFILRDESIKPDFSMFIIDVDDDISPLFNKVNDLCISEGYVRRWGYGCDSEKVAIKLAHNGRKLNLFYLRRMLFLNTHGNSIHVCVEQALREYWGNVRHSLLLGHR